jgi:hypothetical protein
MAFTAPRNTSYPEGREGDLRVARGTFTNTGGDTGGDIVTGLSQVFDVTLTHTGAAVVASAPVVNETIPCSGTVTIVTVADTTGIWVAKGK